MTTKLAFQPACDFLPGDGSSIRSEQQRARGRFVPLRDAFRQEIARTSSRLAQDDGSTWEIQSKAVKLSPHVGHTVSVTGKVWHPDVHGAKEKKRKEKKRVKRPLVAMSRNTADLDATSAKMVSESCKK